ncbi:serine hydrolase domain-containing protein [Blautia sp. HCP3S3_G3]|uniref:serine hydrolase domain-containing protein n=1 Tax=Blautia sp. HCP3S3_G3 TaxID=3438913 RepID=UPI003F8928FC
MYRHLEYTIPEKVGVSSKALLQLIDKLEHSITEPHGILITRHGKVIAEGYWKPYAKGMIHGMQSLTKTYAATAIGIAIEQGIIELDEKIIDIFPDEAGKASQEYLPELTVRHVLSMSTGMRKMSGFEGNWVENFLNNPIIDKPGTMFFYNSVGSTLLGEIIRRKTGDTLDEYLEKNLYGQIGMDPEGIKWLCLPDGLEIGGSGLYSTLENNTKLGLLYMNGGAWEGRQIINREFCKLASEKQIDNSREDCIPADGAMGYGFQMWMGMHHHTYGMCGAWGQYTYMCPDEDIVISFSGRTNDAKQAASDTLLGKFWEFLDTGVDRDLGTPQDTEFLCKKLASLSLPADICQPYGNRDAFLGNWQVAEGELDFDVTSGGIMQVLFPVHKVDEISISFTEDSVKLRIHNSVGWHEIEAGMDGLPRLNHISTPPYPCDKMYATAAFDKEKLVLSVRWLETCYSAKISFERVSDGIVATKVFNDVDPLGEGVIHRAKVIKKH